MTEDFFKKSKKNLVEIKRLVPLQSAFKKSGLVLHKQVDYQAKCFWSFFKKNKEIFGRNKKALSFALPIKKRGAGKTAKDLWKLGNNSTSFRSNSGGKQIGKSS